MKALEHLPSVETQDVRPRRILLSLSLVFLLMACCIGVAVAAVSWSIPFRPAAQWPQMRSGIRLEVDPKADDHRIEAEAAKPLGSMGWNDATQTSAHIPIERAMDMMARQGWPDRGTPQGAVP